MTGWRLLDTGAHDGAWNMAADVALMERARRTGETVFRAYAWSRPTLSFGRHESARGRFSAARIAAAGLDAVRRPTGGRALLHDHEVTYSVTAPVDAAESLGDSVRRINGILRCALRALGADAVEAEAPRTLRPEGAACFAVPAPGELTLGGRKIAGSAQVRHDGALLQHGSILLDDDQGRIASLTDGPFLAAAPAASLRAALGAGVGYAEVRDALFNEVARLAGRAAGSLVLPLDDGALLAPSLEAPLAQFRDAAWTWRR
ncbi:MAG: lipoate--protein ligase family protein [Gemmatimonadaceae bacterium]